METISTEIYGNEGKRSHTDSTVKEEKRVIIALYLIKNGNKLCDALRCDVTSLCLYTHFFPTVYVCLCLFIFGPMKNWIFVGALQIFSLETSNDLKTHTEYVCESVMHEYTYSSSIANALNW